MLNSPVFMWIMIGFMLGMMFGMYVGNKKLRRAVNNMFKHDEDDEEDEEDY